MANKLYVMEQLTEEVAKDVAASPQEWMRFLNTASRLYKYTFPEQLLIYAQRPEATAVASMEIWNQKMYRWIKKGSKGIALIDNTSGPKTKLRYVFDVQDTYKVRNLGKDPQLWNFPVEGEHLVADYLQEQLSLEDTEGGLAESLHQAAKESMQEWLPDALEELRLDVTGTFLEELDEQNQEVEFRELMTNSVWCVLLNRCGLDVQEYLDAEDFRHITDFNQLKVLGHLGSAVNEISRPVLMQIGRYVLNDLENDLKTVAKEKEVAYNEFNTLIRENNTDNTEDREEKKEETDYERDQLQPERRVSDSRYQPGRDERNDREIWNDEERVSEKPQGSQVQYSDTAEPSGQSSDGDRQSGKAESRQPDERTSGERSGTGQDGRHNGVDQTHEPDQGTGRGTGNSGDYLQLSLFPTEEEQLGEIRKAAAALEQPAAFLISDEVVDDILRTGSGQKNTLFHITARLIEGLDNEEMQSFLKEEYGTGGKGFTIDGQKISIWYDNDGIRIRRGDSARRNFDRIVTWEEAADRIQDMYEEGNYVDNLISNNAIEQEQKEMTDLLALHFRDTSRNREERLSYSDWQDVVGAAWTDPEEAAATAYRFEWLQEDMEKNPEDYHRWEIQHNPEYFQRYKDLQRERSWVDQQFKVERPALSFITQDEIDAVLRRGGITAGGRNRIYEYFMEHHDMKDAAEFLKNEYGTGGSSPGILGADASDASHDAKGLKLAKGKIGSPEVEILLKWNKVAERVRQLIRTDDFLSPEELEKYEERQEAQRLADLEEAQQMLGEQLEQDTLTAEDITDLRLVDSEYMSGTRTKIHDFDCKVKGEANRLQYTLEYHDDGEGFTIHTEKDDIWNRMSTQELERLDVKLGQEVLYYHYHNKTVNADTLDELREIREEIMEEESSYFTAISQRVWTDYDKKEKELSGEVEVSEEKESLEEINGISETIPATNFRITDDELGQGTAKEKFRANIMAIQLLKKCEDENRNATPEEQEILSRYVGWGGLADAFDETKAAWETEYLELKTVLTPEEYAAARASTLNAHYTQPIVIESMYQVLENLGFTKGNILEPSMGVGNFFGMLPENLNQSKLYGVELDSISGRIAKLLYPDANIQIKGFEKTDYPNDFFDVAIGNVPFGAYKVNDRQYDRYNFMIHDYFLVKTIDQLRPGGVAALITTKGTMDKASPEVRKYLAERADLLGAIRLPNTAFKANAGTEVSADILFFQKRESLTKEMPEWINLDSDVNGITVNQYFVQHPEMILGEMKEVSGPYGMETTCAPMEGADLELQLAEAVKHIKGSMAPVVDVETELDEMPESIPADPNVRNYSYTVVDDQVYYRVNSLMNQVKMPAATAERVKGMVAIRDTVRELIALQMEENVTDEEIQKQQEKLNQVYDTYTVKYGVIGSNANKRAFSDDSSYCLLCSLEDLNEDGTLKRKADMFTKRTIKKAVAVTSVETATEALALSLNERAKVDLTYMAQLTGKTEEKITEELVGVIFKNPLTDQWESGDEYLSGNVRDKLNTARTFAESHPEFTPNVRALEAVQQRDLEASEIEVRVGATWIEPSDYQDFMVELLHTPWYLAQKEIQVKFSEVNGEWRITGKNADNQRNAFAYATYGTERANAYKILEDEQDGGRYTVKQIEKTRKTLQTRLEKLNQKEKKDQVVTFEELGVDHLYVDEAHSYKNAFLYTKMRNVAGIAQNEAQKSADMFNKCQYLDEITGGKGITFATGTPISNSMTELYVMQRYLQNSKLQNMGLGLFDSWASTFGEVVTSIELAPEGTGYRAKSRFARFYNIPELMNMFKEIADIKTSDQLKLPVPEAEYETVVLKPTEQQKEIVESLGERAEVVRNGGVDASVDNMLKITNDGRKLALDQRLVNELLPDNPESKISVCAEKSYEIWKDTAAQKSAQLIFCDLSTPKGDGSFNVYDDLKQKLMEKGVPEKEIAFIHDANTEAKKTELFGKVKSGQVRFLIGSTAKMGAGTNVQDRLIALHHLDIGWKPSDLEQREGRIIRQGNHNKKVHIFRYVTESTFDSYMWQLIENKQKFISQIMTSKAPVRSCEDVDEAALSYAEVKALATGNPAVKEKMALDVDVAKLKLLKANHMNNQYRLEDDIARNFPQQIAKLTEIIDSYKADIAHFSEHKITDPEQFSMEISGKVFTEKKEAGMALLAVCKDIKSVDAAMDIGSYQGFNMRIQFDSWSKEFILSVKHESVAKVRLGADALGNITRINNLLESYPEKLAEAEQRLETVQEQMANAKEEVGKPFPKEEELNQKLERLSELNALLNMDEREDTETEQSESKEKEERPARGSIHEKLQIYKEKSQRESETGKETRKRDFGLE